MRESARRRLCRFQGRAPGALHAIKRAMNELIEKLVSQVGLDADMAKKVVAFLQENADKIPEWLGSADKLKEMAESIPGVGGLLK